MAFSLTGFPEGMFWAVLASLDTVFTMSQAILRVLYAYRVI